MPQTYSPARPAFWFISDSMLRMRVLLRGFKEPAA